MVFWTFLALLFIASLIFIFMSISTHKKKTVTVENIQIISSVPANESSSFSVFDPIVLTFNQEINPTSINVFSDPYEVWSVYQRSENSVVLNHKSYLSVATKYKLTISYNNKVVGTLNFETAKEQNDPKLLQSLQLEMDRDYPLAKLTPYETPDYKVVYVAPLTLEISIKSQINSQTAIEKVQSWVKQNGIDPSTHKYVVAQQH